MSPEPTQKKRDPRALNAYRHGLTGQIRLFTPADELAYKTHCEGYHAALAPLGAFEADLVQSVADDRWRLKRAVAFENAIFADGITDPDETHCDIEEVNVAFAHARVWIERGKSIALLSTYERRIQRNVEKNLEILRRAQADRRAALEKVVEEVALLTQLAESEGERYDIDRDYPRETLPPDFVFSTPQIARLAAHKIRVGQASRPVQAAPKPLRRAA